MTDSIFSSARIALSALDIDLSYLSSRGLTRSVLLDVCLEGHPGEVLALAGRSGAGKTSLLRVLYGMQEPSAGAVWWGTEELARLSEKQRQTVRRKHFGYASQDAVVLEEETLEANVRLAGAAREAALEYLNELELGGLAEARAGVLSGGERQRVAVARALAKRPAVALLDEPTASLDSAAAYLVRDLLLASAAQGAAVVVATHDDVILQCAHRVVQL